MSEKIDTLYAILETVLIPAFSKAVHDRNKEQADWLIGQIKEIWKDIDMETWRLEDPEYKKLAAREEMK